MMKERIRKNLNRVSELQDRKLLKETLDFVFENMIDYTDMVYDHIERRVFEEINGKEENKKIYVTLIDQRQYDEIDEFMYPMVSQDVSGKKLETDTLIKKQKHGEKVVIGTTYLSMDYLELQKLDLEKAYDAFLITEEKRYQVKVHLAPSDKYQKVIRQLYQYFQQNNIEWVTINAPYIKKYYDFVLVEPVEFEAGQVIERYEVSLGELETVRQDRMIPCWNLEETDLISTNFPTATGDMLRFQHTFDMESEEEVNAVIVKFEEEHDGYVMRERQSISILISEESISKWPIYKIHSPREEVSYDYKNCVYSNGHKEQFMVGFAKRQRRTVRSQAELYRILQSYEVSELFEFEKIEICENTGILPETYEINTFIEDDIRTDVKRKCLLVTAKCKEENYLARDVLSFLVSEIQYYFPEYACVGKIG